MQTFILELTLNDAMGIHELDINQLSLANTLVLRCHARIRLIIIRSGLNPKNTQTVINFILVL